MRGRGLLCVAAIIAAGVCAPPASAVVRWSNDVYIRITDDSAVIGNSFVERSWGLRAFKTTSLIDKRGSDRQWGTSHRDFSVGLAALQFGSELFQATDVSAQRTSHHGLRLVMGLRSTIAPVVDVVRTVEVFPGIAGFRTETTISSKTGFVMTNATPEEIAVGPATPTLHAFRAGADWRELGWQGPTVPIGDGHGGTWRASSSAARGSALSGPGEWLSLADGDRNAIVVMERNDMPSSRMDYDGTVARALIDHSRDVVSLGPIESDLHVENPLPAGETRARIMKPGETITLAPVFTGFGDHDGDDAWQFHKYLERVTAPYPHTVTFNSNGTDDNVISTGAKDDMDFATVQQVAAIAKRMGVETFILDDGWQARSGDWCPDSPQCPEPRYDGTRFKPRFPDDTFAAVRAAISPMKLGLWMSPTFFNPNSATFAAHPEWTCLPLGAALAALNIADPESGSNEAGFAAWSPAAIGHIESRVRKAIDEWGVSYFKFDFLTWLDCIDGVSGFTDMYAFHDAFLAMLDRIHGDHPTITFQIDETNDYRMFPFESVVRGPSWFQNGHPTQRQALHNLWNLSPYIPTFSLGQNALADEHFNDVSVDALMAGSLLSHVTFFSDLRKLPSSVVDRVGVWTAFYREHRDQLDGVVYPLLADPADIGWTALQTWDPDLGRGALLSFRQSSDVGAMRVALRNVPDGTYELHAAPDNELLGTVTAEELRSGLDVTIAAKDDANVVLIDRV